MARNTLEKLRDCMANGSPEILWQPEFDRARQILEKSLLNPAPHTILNGGPPGD
jgi:quinolinate synthase